MQTRKIDETHWKYRSHIIAETDYTVDVTYVSGEGKTRTEPRPVYTVEGEYANYGYEDGITTLANAKSVVDDAIQDAVRRGVA